MLTASVTAPRRVAAFAALVALIAGIAAASMLDSKHLRGPLIRYFAARTGRQIRIDGGFETHILTRHPGLIAEHVLIGNPPWAPPGSTAEIGRLALNFDLPTLTHGFAVHRLEIDAAVLHLQRDSQGRANWQWSEPGGKPTGGGPMLRSLSMRDAQLQLDDARRHLQFTGIISAGDAGDERGARPLRIDGAGKLNGRDTVFRIDADPLAVASHRDPYHFTFDERSSGSHLHGQGLLSRPFDFDALDTGFEASGEDLKDLYFLTGVTLPDTGAYHVTGKIERRRTTTRFIDLAATSGQSDMSGTLSIETSSGHPRFEGELQSQLLRSSDLGARAAGRVPVGQPALLFAEIAIPVAGIRRGDAVVNFKAYELDAGRVRLHAAAARMRIDHGALVVAPITAVLGGGTIVGRARIDAQPEVPTADAQLRMADVQLGLVQRVGHAQGVKPPPLEGLLRARLALRGRGRSIHELAAHANGTVSLVLPHGAIRDSLAELTGFDLLRSLGLLAAKNQSETSVRCGVASFEVSDGVAAAQTAVVDTEPVLITGMGSVDFKTEAVEFKVHGQPKNWRLGRVRAPLWVRGTLLHPSFKIEARGAVAQAGAAIALGVVLTPIAAALAFVDPGLAKDADCAALLQDQRFKY